MCGIAGIIGRIDEPNRLALQAMADAMRHRGPNGEGIWTSPPDSRGHGCLLAHRRLSILDLTNFASQPMTDPATGQTVVFNGEIYNYESLRAEMVAQGQSFTSTGDTAILLRKLALEGPSSVGALRGMFAFALWNPSARTLTLARDPLGIKPLYLYRNPDPNPDRAWSLIFASEIRALLAGGLLPRRLDPTAIASIVWNGFVTAPGAIVAGVEELPPGTIEVLDAHAKPLHRDTFWTLPRPRPDRNVTEADLHDALRESVRLHLASDVPLGVFLSGGVDSSAIANLAQQASTDRVNTFTLAFEESDYNEGHIARAVADQIGSRHHEITLTQSHFVDQLDAAIDSLDQPTFDGINSYFISRAVREAGLTVALIGTGGDELFGGYKSFSELPRFQTLARRARFIPLPLRLKVAHAIARWKYGKSTGVGPQTRWAKLPDMLRVGDDLLGLYQLAYALFLPAFQARLLDGSTATPPRHRQDGSWRGVQALDGPTATPPGHRQEGSVRGAQALDGPTATSPGHRQERLGRGAQVLEGPTESSPMLSGLPAALHQRLRAEIEQHPPHSAISALELRLFLGQRLLRDTDAASMAVSLEVRLPLVDSVLTETLAGVPDDLRYNPLGRKQLLRNVGLRGLDPALFERPKSGFVMPFDRWIRTHLGQIMDRTMRDPDAARAVGLNPDAVSRLWDAFQAGGKGMYWSRVWALYILMRWARKHQLTLN